MITTEPVETFDLGIGAFLIFYPVIEIDLIERVIALQHGIVIDHLLGTATAVWKLPQLLGRAGVSFYVFNIPAAFEQQNLEAFFSKFFCSPSATDAGTDHD